MIHTTFFFFLWMLRLFGVVCNNSNLNFNKECAYFISVLTHLQNDKRNNYFTKLLDGLRMVNPENVMFSDMKSQKMLIYLAFYTLLSLLFLYQNAFTDGKSWVYRR